jgi:GNAT superfamily N-acetyltransferase
MEIVIRTAKRDDLSSIFGLVKELAIYEREPEAVTSTIQDYYDAYDSELIHCVVAELGGKIVGMTVSFKFFSTWRGMGLYLEDFYIQIEHRRYGIGQMLYDRFIKDAKSLNANIVKWQVLDWNDSAVKFYEKNEAHIDKGWWNCKVLLNQ